MKDQIIISRELAYKCANALIETHNTKDSGSVRLFSFRQLCLDLEALGQQHLISAAIKPTDFPKVSWFPKNFKR